MGCKNEPLIELYTIFERAAGIADLEAESVMHPRVVKLLYNSQRRLLIQEVVKEGTRVTDSVYVLFDELQPVYSALSAKIRKRC